MDSYVDSLVAEIAAARVRARGLGARLPEIVDTVYFGGGTPSLLKPEQLRRIFAGLRGDFEIACDAEMTFECAPGQIAEETLTEALRQGVNRVSFGVQSFVDAETAAVGRLHTAEQCRAEVTRAKEAGISRISLDLIAGLPGQTAESWERSLDQVIECDVSHASVYMLEVDEDSRLGNELISGGSRYQAATVPNDEAATEFYGRACDRFHRAGLKQYEISNFARAGNESRHNLKYWQRDPYLGFGVDAHSMLRLHHGAVRYSNADSLEAYAAESGREVADIDDDTAFEEALFLGLRKNQGVSLDDLRFEFGEGRVKTFEMTASQLADDGLLAREGNSIALTHRGRLVSNEIFAELLQVAV